jgi:hypothetical protein
MPFEQPNPALYPPPASLQPKRPVTAATSKAVPAVDTNPAATPEGRGSIAQSESTATAAPTAGPDATPQQDPARIPASAMRTGTTPLSQTQKRAFSLQPEDKDETGEVDRKREAWFREKPKVMEKWNRRKQAMIFRGYTDPAFPPNLHFRIPDFPASWPVYGVKYGRKRIFWRRKPRHFPTPDPMPDVFRELVEEDLAKKAMEDEKNTAEDQVAEADDNTSSTSERAKASE